MSQTIVDPPTVVDEFQLYFHFQGSNRTVPLRKMIAGRTVNPERRVDFGLSEYFTGNVGNVLRISSRHFAIHKKDGRFFIEDLQSANGTSLDGEILTPGIRKQIRNNSEIIIAPKNRDFTIKVLDEQPERPVSELTTSEDREYFYLNGKEVILTETQTRLMQYLYSNIGRTCPNHEIHRAIWFGVGTRGVITQTIKKIRRRLDKLELGAGTNHIRTVAGVGYRLIPEYEL